MKRSTLFLTALTVWLFLAGVPLFAQHGGGGHGGGMGGGAGVGRGSTDSSRRPDVGQGRMKDMGRSSPAMTAKKPAGEILSHNTKLASKLQSLLPPGTNLQEAAAGFKNLGQFVAAVHVSHNLGIPFDELKAKMTGPNAESLGKAIHDLKPDVKAKSEAKNAHRQAESDIRESESETAPEPNS